MKYFIQWSVFCRQDFYILDLMLSWTKLEKAFMSAHHSGGVSFYHHLILVFQQEYGLELTGTIEFAYPSQQNDYSNVNFSVTNFFMPKFTN